MFDLNRKSDSNKKLSKIAMLFFAGLLLINTFGSLAYAAPTTSDTTGAYDQNGNLNIRACIKKGNFDLMAFLQATLWSETFLEGLIEPWDDVLIRNACQAFDIFGLVQQRDKLRKQIRDAFLTCRNDKVPKLKKAYYKTVVEIGFAREVVYGGPITRQFADMDVLLNSLESRYVGEYHWFGSSEFSVFKNELKLRYLDRRAAYVDQCDQGSWAEVKRKFVEFNKTVIQGGFVDDVKKAGAGIVRKAQKIKQAVGNASSWESWAKGLGELVQVNLNGQACGVTDTSGCGEFWTQFKGEASKNNPFTKTNFPSTTQGIFETRKWSDFALRQMSLKNEMTLRFQMLYGSAGDSSLRLFIDEAKQLNEVIKASFVPLNDISECAKTMNRKQCKK